MEVDEPKVESTTSGSKVSGTNFVLSEEILNPHSMNWNLTRPFRHSQVEAVWSNLGDIGQSSRMSVVVDIKDDNDASFGEFPDLSRDEDVSSAKEDDAINDQDKNNLEY